MTEPRTTAPPAMRPLLADPAPQRFPSRTYDVASVPRYVPRRRRGNGLGTAARTLGVLGLALCWVPIVGVLCGLLGIAFGIAGFKRGKQDATGTNSALTGLVLGAVALVPAVVILVVVIGA